MTLSRWSLGIVLTLGLVAWAGFSLKERSDAPSLPIRLVEADGKSVLLPPDQQHFIDSVDRYRKQFRAAVSTEREVEVRDERGVLLREMLSSCHITEWVGSVISRHDAKTGPSLIRVEVGDHVFLNGEANSSIKASPRGAGKRRALERGDQVIFTGYFLSDEDETFMFDDQSLRASMISPEFLFHFEYMESISL